MIEAYVFQYSWDWITDGEHQMLRLQYLQKARNVKTRTNQNLLMYRMNNNINTSTGQLIGFIRTHRTQVLHWPRVWHMPICCNRDKDWSWRILSVQQIVSITHYYSRKRIQTTEPNRTKPTNHVATVAPFCVVLCCGTVCSCSCCSILRCVRSPRARQQQHGITRLSPPFFRCLRHHRCGDTRRHDIVPFVRERQGHKRYCELFQC